MEFGELLDAVRDDPSTTTEEEDRGLGVSEATAVDEVQGVLRQGEGDTSALHTGA
jgi:hypothetical protein